MSFLKKIYSLQKDDKQVSMLRIHTIETSYNFDNYLLIIWDYGRIKDLIKFRNDLLPKKKCSTTK
jgi:hypothetical protein